MVSTLVALAFAELVLRWIAAPPRALRLGQLDRVLEGSEKHRFVDFIESDGELFWRFSPNVKLADDARLIGPAPAAESYLKIDAILSEAAAMLEEVAHSLSAYQEGLEFEPGRLEEIEDRYGHLPPEVENLLELACIRTLAEQLGIVQVEAKGDALKYHFVDAAPVDPGRLLSWVQSLGNLSLSPSRVLTVPASSDPDVRLENCRETLESLAEMIPQEGVAS